ncbi:MAG TPA: adenylyltransferase/cytidyltransferase family protein [Saprospiraceae bacterium]|nr:adenylyltransferase/cytidyltransferase family protein [Saprospiraceae bacterium]
MDSQEQIIVASGYMDPLTIGHIDYLEQAKSLGGILVVIINTDAQAKLKKGASFMKEDERMKIVSSLKCVDKVVLSIDEDRTVCKTLEMIKPNIFAKGGDTSMACANIPEGEICKRLNIKIVDGLGDKIQSSRWLLKECKERLSKISDSYLQETSM